jgi:outer membrane receptor protein involved in Fe transport
MEFAGLVGMKITSITALADSDIVFSYDADWGNADSWAPVTYDYVSSSDRRRKTASQELRLVAAEWLVGAYAMRLEDKLLTVSRGEYYDPLFDFADSLDDTLGSDYAATSFAVFGQYERTLGSATRMSAGLRMERRTTDYRDTAGLRAGPAESMLGGELVLSHDHSELLTSFASLSKGYKAGGFNLGQVPDDRREFAAEDLWNLEAGIRSHSRDGTLAASALLFASRRDDQQVRTSAQLVSGDPASFVFFTDNAAKGVTFGFEADVRWMPDEAWSLYANLGLLNAKFDEFRTPLVDLSGREQAHAPDYTWAVGGSFRHPGGMFVRADITARDAFYFDVSHDQMSSAYQLVSARVGYETVNWTAQLWARNVLDERYAVRGFFFGNEPPDFPDRLYTRPGDPRQIGFTFDLMF